MNVLCSLAYHISKQSYFMYDTDNQSPEDRPIFAHKYDYAIVVKTHGNFNFKNRPRLWIIYLLQNKY